MKDLKKYRDRIVITALVVILLIVIGFTSGGRNGLSIVERVIGDVFSPVMTGVSYVGNAISETVDSIVEIPSLKSKNEYLEMENARLHDDNLKLHDTIARTDYLKKEYEIEKKNGDDFVKANIIGKEPGNWFDRIVIDKGTLDGISKDDTVVVGVTSGDNVVVEGLVGKISEVGDNFAKVTTILEEANSVSFKNIRTQDTGVLNGAANSTLEGYLFYNQADIVADDRLYTSGMGNLYSGDIFIGRVSNVISDEQDMKKKIVVSPAVDFKKLYRVFVIKSEVRTDENN